MLRLTSSTSNVLKYYYCVNYTHIYTLYKYIIIIKAHIFISHLGGPQKKHNRAASFTLLIRINDNHVESNVIKFYHD